MAKPKDAKRTKGEILRAKLELARMAKANKKTKRSKKKSTKRKKKSGPTAFQRYLMRDPSGAKKKMGW